MNAEKENSSDPPDSDALLMIALVEWEDDHDATKHATTKLRIRFTDVTNPPNVGLEDLERTILRFHRENDTWKVDLPLTTMRIRVYDSHQLDYVTLVDRSEDIVRQYGTRIRVLVGSTTVAPSSSSSSPNPQFLAIQGRYFDDDFVNGRIAVGGRILSLHQDPNQSLTGTCVWDGAILLTRYIEANPELVQNKCVLELGSGCGLVGLAAGVLGANSVCLTDLDYCLNLQKLNIDANKSLLQCEHIECCECDWYNPPKRLMHDKESSTLDVILAADCVWLEELVLPLLTTLHKISCCHDATVLISYQQRGKATHRAFWKGLQESFTVELLPSLHATQPPTLQLISCRPLCP